MLQLSVNSEFKKPWLPRLYTVAVVVVTTSVDESNVNLACTVKVSNEVLEFVSLKVTVFEVQAADSDGARSVTVSVKAIPSMSH